MQKEYVSYALRAYPGALEPFVDPEDCVVTAENWEEHLGSNKFGSGREFDKRWYSAYRDFFKKECHDKGRKETVSKIFCWKSVIFHRSRAISHVLSEDLQERPFTH